MSCCGQKRAALVQNSTTAESGPPVNIVFTGRTAILVRGPVTGRHYRFHAGANTHAVDPRDAVAMLKTGYFVAA